MIKKDPIMNNTEEERKKKKPELQIKNTWQKNIQVEQDVRAEQWQEECRPATIVLVAIVVKNDFA